MRCMGMCPVLADVPVPACTVGGAACPFRGAAFCLVPVLRPNSRRLARVTNVQGWRATGSTGLPPGCCAPGRCRLLASPNEATGNSPGRRRRRTPRISYGMSPGTPGSDCLAPQPSCSRSIASCDGEPFVPIGRGAGIDHRRARNNGRLARPCARSSTWSVQNGGGADTPIPRSSPGVDGPSARGSSSGEQHYSSSSARARFQFSDRDSVRCV